MSHCWTFQNVWRCKSPDCCLIELNGWNETRQWISLPEIPATAMRIQVIEKMIRVCNDGLSPTSYQLALLSFSIIAVKLLIAFQLTWVWGINCAWVRWSILRSIPSKRNVSRLQIAFEKNFLVKQWRKKEDGNVWENEAIFGAYFVFKYSS